MKKILLYTAFIISSLSLSSHVTTPRPLREGQGDGILTVSQCRDMALKCSEDYKQQVNKQQSATLDQQIARNSYLPQLDGSAMAVYTKDQEIMGYTLQMRGLWYAGISVTQPIYVGGKIIAGNKLAKISGEAARQQVRKTHDQIIADVDNSYYTLLSVREKVKMLEAYQRLMNALYGRINTSVNAEMATDADLLRIKSKQSEIAYQLQKARNGENLCEMSLCSNVGLPLGTSVILADTIITVTRPVSLDENIEDRPEIALLNEQIKASEQQVKMARADYLPQVALSLGYSYYDNLKFKGKYQLEDGSYADFSQTSHKWTPMALLSVSVPIFHWGTEFKKVKQAKIKVENARLDFQKNHRLMSIEARQAVQNLNDGYTMVQTAELGRQQADENLRVMQLKYDTGMSTLTDLLDAQSQWQQARSNLIEAETQYKIYETEYLRVTGKL